MCHFRCSSLFVHVDLPRKLDTPTVRAGQTISHHLGPRPKPQLPWHHTANLLTRQRWLTLPQLQSNHCADHEYAPRVRMFQRSQSRHRLFHTPLRFLNDRQDLQLRSTTALHPQSVNQANHHAKKHPPPHLPDNAAHLQQPKYLHIYRQPNPLLNPMDQNHQLLPTDQKPHH